MKPTLVVVVLVVIGVVVLLLVWSRRDQESVRPREFKSTDEYIQFMANAAVEDAAKQDHIQLDYSVDSIRKVEDVLGRMHEEYRKDPNSLSVTALANMYGAYIGEVIRRTEPDASWQRDHSVFGKKTYPLHWSSGDSFPMAWCYKRITEGDGDNVWVKYSVLREKAMHKAVKEPK